MYPIKVHSTRNGMYGDKNMAMIFPYKRMLYLHNFLFRFSMCCFDFAIKHHNDIIIHKNTN